MSAFQIEWTDPPRTWRDDLKDVVDQLKERPGKWALIQRASKNPDPITEHLGDLGADWRTHYTRDAPSYVRSLDIYARWAKEATDD